MLPKNRRLPTPLLLPALKKSTVFSSAHLELRIHRLPREGAGEFVRFAIIIPAKVNKKAVDRHLSKRRISAFLENNLNLIKPGQYLIFRVKKDITKLEVASLEQEIRSLV